MGWRTQSSGTVCVCSSKEAGHNTAAADFEGWKERSGTGEEGAGTGIVEHHHHHHRTEELASLIIYDDSPNLARCYAVLCCALLCYAVS